MQKMFDFIGGSKEEAGEYVVGLERYAMSSLLLLNHLCTFFLLSNADIPHALVRDTSMCTKCCSTLIT